MRLCKDCKYFKPARDGDRHSGLCTHQKAITSVSYHTGIVYRTFASEMRRNRKMCGQSARFYIDKNDIEPIEHSCMIFCTDCKFSMPNTNYYTVASQTEYALCTHPYATSVDMVTGEKLYHYTNTMRNYAKPNDIKSCGTGGYLFEPKDQVMKNVVVDDNQFCATTALLFLLILLL